MEPIRVRNLLSHMNSLDRAELKKLLPAKIKAPETEPIRYPNALLSIFQKEESYAQLGNVAEELLRLPPAEVTVQAACVAALKWDPTLGMEQFEKVRVSKTTQPFLDHIVATRKKLDAVAKGPLRYDEAVQHGGVQGHPDARTDTQLFEVKMTGMLKENWVHFVFQLFAYAALAPEATDAYLVFPMQELLWHADLRTWPDRTKFRDLLNAVAQKRNTNEAHDLVTGAIVRELYFIGCHAKKEKSLVTTIYGFAAHGPRPFQIFLSGPQNSKMHIADDELAGAAAAIQQTKVRLYIHSQYIINLCQEAGTNDDYHTNLLIKNLQYGNAIGSKGVVVHVGKSTGRPLPEAIENMRVNLKRALDYATPECPILLETPAGQGSETLTTYEAFVEFVLKFQDPRLRVCVDTCHVFACGHKPLDYVKRLTQYNKKLLKLIHYNDSATPCGSRLDRHAFMGTGHIGMPTMTDIAKHCHEHQFPMVIE
jgi:deoxyribonuclease IV